MKKLLKISLLAAIFMALLTITSNAATVDYGDLKSDGSMDVTITCDGEIDDAAKTVFEGAGYTVDTSAKTAKITYKGVNEKPTFKYFEFEDICVATPFKMKVGDSRTQTSGTLKSSSDTSVIAIDGNKYTAKKAGTATLTINGNSDKEVYELKITVSGDDSETPSSGNYTAKYEDKKLVISGLPAGGKYRVAVDNDSSKDYSSSVITWELTSDGSNYSSEKTDTDIMQLNKDLYAHIFSTTDDSNYTKVADVKITKPAFNNYNYFSSLSLASYTDAQLLLDIPYSLNSSIAVRSVHYKIGKITDESILRLFKNGDSSGFAKLMEFAENDSSPLYDQTQKADSYNGYHIDGEIIPGTKLSDDAFYYLYAELDDESGKYIPLKSVTLAQADVYPDQNYKWFLFFYGSKELNFDGVSDPTTSDQNQEEKLPERHANTGERTIALALVALTSVIAIVVFRKNKATKIK